MPTQIYHPHTSGHHHRISEHPIARKFIAWCEGEQQHQLFWNGLAFAGHGWLLTPVTLTIIFFLNGPAILLYIAALVMVITLIVNLTSMSTKITIPVFILSIVIDLILIVTSIILY